MKKTGFTLAEILIALSIVGIVAAISLPTLGLDTKKQANEAKLKVVISDLENTFSTMITSETTERLTETKGWNGNNAKFVEECSKYIKTAETTLGDSSNPVFTVKNGATVEVERFSAPDSDDNIGLVYIDVNGKDKPNKKEVDQFKCNLDQYGMLEIIKNEEPTPQ